MNPGVVIRRKRKKVAAETAAYVPAPNKKQPLFAATAVGLNPEKVARFDANPFAATLASFYHHEAPVQSEGAPPAADIPAAETVKAPAAQQTAEAVAVADAAVPEAEAAAPVSEDATAAEAVAPVTADEPAAASPSEEATTAETASPAAEDAAGPPAAEAVATETAEPEAATPAAKVAGKVADKDKATDKAAGHAEADAKPGELSAEEDFSSKVSADDAERITNELLSAAEAREKQAKTASEEGKSAETTVAAPRGGARVLGRIDLNKKATPVRPAPRPGRPETKEAPREAVGTKSRKRKRKVVRKEDLFDAMERSHSARPRKRRAAPGQKVKRTEVTMPKASKRVVRINDISTPGELARGLGVKAGEVLGQLMQLGTMKSINDSIDFETCELVAEEFGYTVENTAVSEDELLDVVLGDEEDEGDRVSRPPVVTVMGHVDHGKTSLLDVIRQANVVSGESGGITQHIGAYMVPTSRGQICFLDTPGHAAFTQMRARGAGVTDLVILVVAADDGVMPQTIEGVNHAKAAGTPVIVAVNKVDKPDANPDRVKQQLSEHGLQPEDWGGDTQFIHVSAIEKTGIEDLLESVALQADMLELTAPVDTRAQGTVVEARLDKGRGPVATVLVRKGTLRRGEHFVCGEITGRVRAMTDHAGKAIEAAGPSTPVEIIGLDGVPGAGESFVVVEDPSRAVQVAEMRREVTRKQQLASSTRMSLEDLQAQISSGEVNELNVIIKADVHGSVEAIRQALEKLSNDEVKLRVIHGAVGAITESDVQLAMASRAIIGGFHVRPEAKARALAERESVDIRLHSVIYEFIDEVTKALEGLLTPDKVETFLGRAEVRDTFSVPNGTIAGCYVTEGSFTRGADCRLLRDGKVIYTGNLSSLRRFKDDVKEVQTGYECGLGLERYNDIKVGDVIEGYRIDEVARKLDSVKRSD